MIFHAHTLIRILFVLLLFVAALMLPWYLFLPLALAGILYFDFFYEALLAGFVFDELHAARIGSFFHFYFVISLVLALCLVAFTYIKEHLILYRKR